MYFYVFMFADFLLVWLDGRKSSVWIPWSCRRHTFFNKQNILSNKHAIY